MLRYSFQLLLTMLFPLALMSQDSEGFAPRQLIVKYKQINNRSASLASHMGYHVVGAQIESLQPLQQNPVNGYVTSVVTFNGEIDVLSLAKELEQSPDVAFAEPNFVGEAGGLPMQVTPADPLFSRQWSLNNRGDFTLTFALEDADIDMTEAWEIEQGDSAVVVAILDSGLKLDHPEFANRIWRNVGDVFDGEDNDNNGYIDDIRGGWDFVNDDNNPTDDHGHGTNVTSILGSNANNNIGYAGIDWNCRLMPLKVIDNDNRGLYSNWASALYYAADNGADVVNMSIGGSSFSQSLEEAIDYAHHKGLILVACMMNEETDRPYYPAGYQNTIAVGSTDPDDLRTSPFFWRSSSGSNYGPHIDVVAPGHYIYGSHFRSNTNFNVYWGGTSQAAPHVTGLASLLLAQDPTRTADDIRVIIRESADDEVGNAFDKPGFDEFYGYGRINAFKALSQTTTSRREIEAPINWSIYPNPSPATQMEYSIEGIDKSDRIYDFRLLDIEGRVLERGRVLNQRIQLNTALQSGVYLLHLQSGAQVLSTEKLIVH